MRPTLKIFWFAVCRLSRQVAPAQYFFFVIFFASMYTVKPLNNVFLLGREQKICSYLPTQPEYSRLVKSKHILKVGLSLEDFM